MKRMILPLLTVILGVGFVSVFIGLVNPAHASADAVQEGEMRAEPAAPARQAGEGIDPEPPVDGPPEGLDSAPDALFAILDPDWVSSFSDRTNSLVWGDYDLDGDLDMLAGIFNGPNRLYINNGSTLSNSLTLSSCELAAPDNTYSVAWGDYDLDGDLDIVVGNDTDKNCVLQNNGGSFNVAWLADDTQSTRSVAWAGWTANNDFSMYFAAGNATDPNAIYRYEAGNFDLWWTESPSSGATDEVAWGDIDNDGDPDLAIGNFGQPNVIYRNDLTTMTKIWTSAESDHTRGLSWGDMNGDGYLDLAVANAKTGGLVEAERVYCNNQDNTFTLCWTSNAIFSAYSVAWGDYDGDGDLDLAASSEVDGFTRVYENLGTMLDTDYTLDADDEFVSSRVVAFADRDGDGDQELSIGYYQNPDEVYVNTRGNFFSSSFGPNVLDTRALAWGDIDGDGDLDLAIGNSSAAPNNIYENVNGTLTLNFTTTETDNTRAVAFGDYDGDGDLDLAVGNGQTSGQANRIYENTGGSFAVTADFTDPSPSDTFGIAFGDIDGDQDLDLVSANFQTSQANRIHINEDGMFTQATALGPASDKSLSVALGDFDQDFDLDILIGNDDGANRLYVNNGSGSFSQVTLPDPNAPCSNDTRSVQFGDWDGDGDLDILTGNAGASGCVQIIETSLPVASQPARGLSFATVWQSVDSSLDVRAVAFGDYDGDGDLDVATGVGGQFGKRNRIYSNINFGQGGLVQTWNAPSATSDPTRAVAWADVDGDSDLDLATANALSPNQPNRLYKNTWHTPQVQLANDPIYVKVLRPDSTDDAFFFSADEIQGQSIIDIPYELFDNQGDMAWRVEHQVSFDGGGNWEPACEVGEFCSSPGGVWNNVAASPSGTPYVFSWNALYHLLEHQGLTLDHDSNLFVPFPQSDEEMDIAFRIVVWSNPYHGGLIQRPVTGNSSSLSRVDLRPDWSSSVKLAAPEFVVPGTQMTYTIEITQTDHGMPPAYILDTLAKELTLLDAPSWNLGYLSYTNQTLTWTNFIQTGPALPAWDNFVTGTDSLAHDDVLRIIYNPWVARPLTNGLQITNTALFFDGMHDPFGIAASFTISSSPELTQSFKLVNGLPANTAIPGERIKYTLWLTNTGTENAYGVVVTDTLPANVIWANDLDTSAGSAFFSNGQVTWLGDLRVFQPVTVTYDVSVVIPIKGNVLITNTFNVNHGSIISAPWTSKPVTTVIQAPDLRASVKQASADVVELGDLLSYSIVLDNVGQTAASPVTLIDPIPNGSTYDSGSLSFSSGFGEYLAPPTDTIAWEGNVPVGGSVTIDFDIGVGMPPLPVNNILTNTAYFEDPLSGVYSVVHTATVLLPDLSASSKTFTPTIAELGKPMTYTIVLDNAGGREPDLQIIDPIPPGSQYIPGSASATAGSIFYDSAQDRMVWNGQVAGQSVVTLTFAITVGMPFQPPEAQIVNTVTFSDSIAQEYTLQTITPVRLPNLSSSDKSGSPGTVELGDVLEYTLSIVNTAGNAPGISLTDPLPGSSTFVTGSFSASTGTGGYSAATNQVTWSGDLGDGESATVTFETLAGCPASGNTLQNLATLKDPVGFETQLSASTVVDMPDLSSSFLLGDRNSVLPGDVIKYDLVVFNDGGRAPDTFVASKLSTSVTYVNGSVTANKGSVSYNAALRQIEWFGDLVNGDSAFITFQVTVNPIVFASFITTTTDFNDGCVTQSQVHSIPLGRIYLPIVIRPQ